jgi:hypothetical protein
VVADDVSDARLIRRQQVERFDKEGGGRFGTRR